MREAASGPELRATLPPAASPSQQVLGLEDEEASLDEYDQYNLAHPYGGKACSASSLDLLLPTSSPQGQDPLIGLLFWLHPSPASLFPGLRSPSHPSTECFLHILGVPPSTDRNSWQDCDCPWAA